MIEDFNNLASDIKLRTKGYDIIYIPNPGNWGDGLIRHGTKVFFEEFGIKYKEVNVSHRWGIFSLLPYLVCSLFGKYFFIYGGGGAWCSAWPGSKRLVKYMCNFTDRLLVLPSTYELSISGEKGVFYRRGLKESAVNFPSSFFCHDMALYLEVANKNCFKNHPKNRRVGVFMRSDKESLIQINEVNVESVDISTLGSHLSSGEKFMKEVAECEIVFTDRLHVAIAGCIAGRMVHLLCGKYFKIEEVYNASLKSNYCDLKIYTDAEEFFKKLNLCLHVTKPIRNIENAA